MTVVSMVFVMLTLEIFRTIAACDVTMEQNLPTISNSLFNSITTNPAPVDETAFHHSRLWESTQLIVGTSLFEYGIIISPRRAGIANIHWGNALAPSEISSFRTSGTPVDSGGRYDQT